MRIGLIFGGKSTEHVVSVLSANNIERELLALGHTVLPFFVDAAGRWFFVEKMKDTPLKKSLTHLRPITFNMTTFEPFASLDLFFPLIHGTFGEDGGLQGFLRLLDKPFIGPDSLNSAIGMDKETTKRLLSASGFDIVPYVTLRKYEPYDINAIIEKVELPCFVKPSGLGSSIAITKAKNKQELQEAIQIAFEHDLKILIESYVDGIDVECAVMKTFDPIVSLPIAIRTTHEFYDYDAKYFDQEALFVEAPMQLSDDATKALQALTLEVYRSLRCESMTRVDYLMRSDGKLFVNEINTIPGFTDSSGFPLAFAVSGYPYPRVLTELIDDALKLHQMKKELTVVSPNLSLLSSIAQ